MTKRFPSPCGDVVLKLNMQASIGVYTRNVSVPLRGCGFEICRAFGVLKGDCLVSVPLRGCGFEMRNEQE